MRKNEIMKREIPETDEIEFQIKDEKGDTSHSSRFKKPHSTYVDWWLQYLEQEIEAVKKDLKDLKDKLKGGRARP